MIIIIISVSLSILYFKVLTQQLLESINNNNNNNNNTICCHSARYPWSAHVQSVGWTLNFLSRIFLSTTSDFTDSYTVRVYVRKESEVTII
jgi:hypothetical protein